MRFILSALLFFSIVILCKGRAQENAVDAKSREVTVKELYKLGDAELAKNGRRATGHYIATVTMSDDSIGVIRWDTIGDLRKMTDSPGYVKTEIGTKPACVFKVVRIVNEKELISNLNGEYVYISDIDTSKMVDDQPLEIQNTVFRYVGPRHYTAPNGAPRTLHELRKVTLKDK